MKIATKFFFCILFASGASLKANEAERPIATDSPIHLKYLKVGTELGIGYRYHRKMHGVDLSLNASSVFFINNWINAKALYLNYPLYSHQQLFYWGVGAGIVHEAGFVLMGGPLSGGGCVHRTYPSFESAIGYEFRSQKKVKLFVQVECGIPLAHHCDSPFLPALVLGIGF